MWALSAFPAFCETGHRSFYQPGQSGTIFWLLSEIQLAQVAMNYFRISTAQNIKQNTKKRQRHIYKHYFKSGLELFSLALALAGQAEAQPGDFITNQPLGPPWCPILEIFLQGKLLLKPGPVIFLWWYGRIWCKLLWQCYWSGTCENPELQICRACMLRPASGTWLAMSAN